MSIFKITADDGSRQIPFLVVMCVFVVASYVTVILRLYCRHFYLRNIAIDDYIMVAALVSNTGLAVMNCYHIALGTGRHTDDLDLEAIIIPTLKHFYAFQVVYPFVLYLVKMSILALYYRILTQQNFRKLVYGVGMLISVQTLVVMFVSAFECRSHPERAWSPTFPAGCNNVSASYYSMSSINIVADLIVLVLPLPVLSKIQLNSRRRLALLGIFSTGAVAIMASMLRFYALYKYATSNDVAYDAIYILLWSQIEVNFAIISASAPALRPLFKKTFENSSNRSAGYGYGQSPGHAFTSRVRGTSRGVMELQSYNEGIETVIEGGRERDRGTRKGVFVKMADIGDNNSSEEDILERRRGMGAPGITRTVETSIETR